MYWKLSIKLLTACQYVRLFGREVVANFQTMYNTVMKGQKKRCEYISFQRKCEYNIQSRSVLRENIVLVKKSSVMALTSSRLSETVYLQGTVKWEFKRKSLKIGDSCYVLNTENKQVLHICMLVEFNKWFKQIVTSRKLL